MYRVIGYSKGKSSILIEGSYAQCVGFMVSPNSAAKKFRSWELVTRPVSLLSERGAEDLVLKE